MGNTGRAVNQSALADRVRNIVWTNAPIALPRPPRDDEDLVDHLGYHSVVLTELALTLSDEFGVDAIATSEFEDIRTVGDVIALVAGLTDGTLSAG